VGSGGGRPDHDLGAFAPAVTTLMRESRVTEIPFVDLRAQSRALHDDYEGALWPVIDRAAFSLGPELVEFEEAFAAYCESGYCVGVSSGTDAVKLALLAAGAGPGDEVIVPVNTFIATAEAVSHLGARPVFVDVLADTALIDPQAVAGAVTDATRAVVPVHLFGQPADMEAVQAVADECALLVVEDACQAHGARYRGKRVGSLSAAAAFSFYPGKNLGALGDGGAVTTNVLEVDERLRLYRNHGQADKHTHAVIGYCDRLHNLQAALLSAKLRHLDGWNAARRAAARRYDELLADVEGVTPIVCREDVEPVYHLYVVQVDDRDRVGDELGETGVQTGIHYPVPLHLQPAYAHLGHGRGDFPVAEALADRILSLPMFPEMAPEQQERVAATLAQAVARG
jgi:dTDP-4-amino-4,6-dideoxygalactose transaminase